MLPHAALALAFLFTKPAPLPPPKDQPVARYSIPLSIPTGPKAKLVLRGAKLDAATEVKADAGTLKITRKGKVTPPNNYPAEKIGDSEVEVELDLPADFKGDAVKVSVVTPDGTSEPLTVPLGKGATAEKEPNDGFDKAQELSLPATVDATIGRERDADVFKIVGKKGQKLAIAAGSHGGPADLLFSVYDANRQLLLTVDDVGGKTDPSADVTLPADGVYYVSVIEAHDLGGTGFGYRLTVK
jgi:Bacterial pre-peptidase C-terminal domain